MTLSFMEGNEALARGAVAAGCSFFAGYPITPATTVFNHMLAMLPSSGGICIQAEDEIAAIGSCLGASMTGRKVMTATSGPGISLMSEQISLAIGSEIPVVIADIQRLGPSTGSATRGADGDIQFLRWGNSGGLPVIVLSPNDVSDCFELAVHAFNFAEQYRCPVFIASGKEIGMTKESIDLETVQLPEIIKRTPFTGKSFLPFKANQTGVPPFCAIGGPTVVRQTSSTHGPEGYITTDPEIIAENRERLKRKILDASDRIALWKTNLNKNSQTLVISYGATSRTVHDAAALLEKKGNPVSTLNLKTLWPVPERLIKQTAEPYKHIVIVEMNQGLYIREVQRILKDKKILFYGQMDGRLITPEKIIEVIEHGQPSEY